MLVALSITNKHFILYTADLSKGNSQDKSNFSKIPTKHSDNTKRRKTTMRCSVKHKLAGPYIQSAA